MILDFFILALPRLDIQLSVNNLNDLSSDHISALKLNEIPDL